MRRLACVLLAVFCGGPSFLGCSSSERPVPDSGPAPFDATEDAEVQDADPLDADVEDAFIADAEPDASVDSGPPDLGVDAGIPTFCSEDVNATCVSAADCAKPIAPPTNCASCRQTFDALCSQGLCETPPLLDALELYGIVVQVPAPIPAISSIGAFAVTTKTPGTRPVTCADVYAGDVDLSNECFNLIDNLSLAVAQGGDTFTVTFNSFVSGQRTLFVLYGHTQIGSRGDPVGVSCTEVDVAAPGAGQPVFIAGDAMRML